jgi:hypothetical protein
MASKTFKGLPVVRDYIPDPVDATAAERDRFNRARLSARGSTQRDFVPAPGHELRPPSGAKAQADAALTRALARQESAARDDFQTAVKKLKGLNVAQAIEAITQAPPAVADMMLVAEALNGNRTSILQRFAAVDPKSVTRWETINSGGADPAVGGVSTEASEGSVQVQAPAKAEDAKDE